MTNAPTTETVADTVRQGARPRPDAPVLEAADLRALAILPPLVVFAPVRAADAGHAHKEAAS